MSLVKIHDINTNVDSFISSCTEVGVISHQNLSKYEPIFKESLEKMRKDKDYSYKVCVKDVCGFSFLNKSQEDPEKPLDDLFTEQLSHNKTTQYLTYLFYVLLNNSLQKAKIDNYQYIFKGGTSYRASLISLYSLMEKTPEVEQFFREYILDESSLNCMFKVSDFDSIIYLLYSGTPVEYLKKAEFVKSNILHALIKFKELLERDPIFKLQKKKLFSEITQEWKTLEFKSKLVATLREMRPKDEIVEEDVWVQLVSHPNILVIPNALNENYGSVIDLKGVHTNYPRLPKKGYQSTPSPFYISSNEILKYETHLPSQDNPEFYRFVLNRMKLNILVHYGKRKVIKAQAEFIDVAFPLYMDYGLQRYVKEGHYQHLNALTPYELYKGTSEIDFEADIQDIFHKLLGRAGGNISPEQLKVLIYSPYLLFDDLVATLLQKKYPWESQKLEKRVKRFLVMKLLYQLIMKPDRPLTNSLRKSEEYISQVRLFYVHGNHSQDEIVKRRFYDVLERVHQELMKPISKIRIDLDKRDNLYNFFVGGV